MTKINDPKAIGSYIQCLSTLEDIAFRLYHTLADKTEAPLVRTFFLEIALDSQKHSTLLAGIGDSMAVSQKKTQDCKKNLGVIWQTTDKINKEITAIKKIGKEEFSRLAEKLTVLESMLGEEYYILIQMKTLQLMTKEINQLYNIDLDRLKNAFVAVIRDEEHHRELLATIKELLTENDPVKNDNTPMVKWQTPDAWIRKLPPTTHDSH